MKYIDNSNSKVNEKYLSELIDRKIREELAQKNNDDDFDFVDGALLVSAGVNLLVPSILTLL